MSEDAHRIRPVLTTPTVCRWHTLDNVVWWQVMTNLGWRKAGFLGDSIETGDKPERQERYARLQAAIAQDWEGT